MLKSDRSVLSSAHGLHDGCACWPWRNTYSAWRILPSCYISSLITPLPGKSLCSWQIWQSQSHCWLVAWLRHAWTAPELQQPWLDYLWAGHMPLLFWHCCAQLLVPRRDYKTSQQQLSSRSPTPSCNILQYPSCNFLLSGFKVSASHVLLSEVSCARYHFLYSQLVAFCMSHHDSLLRGLFNMQCVLLPQPRPLNDLACDCRGEHCAWLLFWEGWASRYHWEVQVHLSQGFWIHDMY